jgi:hypothetical protein
VLGGRNVVLMRGEELHSMNQPDGLDCPGCAWPDPKHTSSFEFCQNGARAPTFDVTSRRVTRNFFAAPTICELEQHHVHRNVMQDLLRPRPPF